MKKIAIFGFSANPPGNHHFKIVKTLTCLFEKVFVIPRGTNSNKPSIAETTPLQRKEMVKLAFNGLLDMEIDFFDLNNDVFTPTWIIDKKYKVMFPGSEIWHVVGGDLIEGGANGNSEIQKKWRRGKEIWDNLNWAVIDQSNYPINPVDLPPKNILIKMDRFEGRSTEIRNRIKANQSISNLVSPKVEKYIIENNLYK